MNPRDLAVLVEAARSGSLAGAARRLGLEPMTASRRLAALEAQLGVRLAHRSTRSWSLTPEGEALLPHAERILAQEAEARAAVRPAGAGASGTLRITASSAFARKIVAPMAPGLLAANPDLRLDVTVSDGVVDIVGLGIDLALRSAPLRDNGLVARKLSEGPRRLCASPGYLAARGTPRGLADLADHDCLLSAPAARWPFETADGPREARVAGRFGASAIETLLEACAAGAGIGHMAAWNVDPEIAAGRLVEIRLDDARPAALPIWAVRPSSAPTPAKVRVFVEALTARLTQRDAPA